MKSFNMKSCWISPHLFHYTFNSEHDRLEVRLFIDGGVLSESLPGWAVAKGSGRGSTRCHRGTSAWYQGTTESPGQAQCR